MCQGVLLFPIPPFQFFRIAAAVCIIDRTAKNVEYTRVLYGTGFAVRRLIKRFGIFLFQCVYGFDSNGTQVIGDRRTDAGNDSQGIRMGFGFHMRFFLGFFFFSGCTLFAILLFSAFSGCSERDGDCLFLRIAFMP